MLKNLSNTEISNVIDDWVHSERNRKILKRRFIDGITYEKIAEEFYISVTQAKSIVYKEEKELLIHI